MNKIKKFLIIVIYALLGFVFNFIFIYICMTKYNPKEIIIRIIITIAISSSFFYFLGKVNSFLEKHYIKILAVFLTGMLILQIIFGYYLEITPNWDFMYIYQGGINWAETGSFADFNRYYYMYPNNLGPMALFALLFKVAGFFGIRDYYMVATVFNALLNVLMMLVVFLICKKLLSVKSGIFALFIFAVSLPSYFGAAVFYTDVLTMLFPVLFYYLYLQFRGTEERKKQIIFGILMGLTAWIGMELKFTIVIVVIAAFIEMIFNCNIKKILITAGIMALVLILGTNAFNAVIYNGHLDKQIAEKKNFPAMHWVMMGLKGDGSFDQNDEDFTDSFDNAEHRDKAVKKKIRERWSTLGNRGVIQLAIKKGVKCFGDGTYELAAFFYHGMAKNTFLNDFLVAEGKYYAKYQIFCTGIYLGFFWLMIFGVFFNLYGIISREIKSSYNLIPSMSVFGLLLFLIMWEANARYITNYIPMIYICAVIGMENLRKCVIKIKNYIGNSM